MLSMGFDGKSSYQVKWPRSDEDIIRLGEAYLAYEESLAPEAQQVAPALALMQQAVTEAKTAAAAAQNGEIARAAAAELFRQNMATARSYIREAAKQLKVSQRHNLAALEAWGFDTVMGKSGAILVHMPTRQLDFINMLGRYTAKEASLPPEQQVADPPLAEMEALHSSIITHYFGRESGRAQRRSAIADRSPAVERLFNLLQLAAGNLVMLGYNGKLLPALANWGYTVQDRRSSSSANGSSDPTTETAVAVTAMGAPETTLDTAPLAAPTANGVAH